MKRNRNRSRYTVRYRLHPAKMRAGEKFYTGRVVHGHTIGLDAFVQLMEERGTTVRKTDSIAVIHLMETVIDDEMCRGNVVDLPFGKFSLGLKGRFEEGDHNNPGVEPFNRKKHRFVPQVSFRKEFVKRIELEHIIPERTDDMFKRVNRRRRKSSYDEFARLIQERQEEDEQFEALAAQEEAQVAAQEAQVAAQEAQVAEPAQDTHAVPVEPTVPQLVRLNLPSAMEEQDEVEQVEQVVLPAQDIKPAAPQLVRLNLPSAMEEHDEVEAPAAKPTVPQLVRLNLPSALEDEPVTLVKPTVKQLPMQVPLRTRISLPSSMEDEYIPRPDLLPGIAYDDYSLAGALGALGGAACEIRQKNGKKSPAKYKSRRQLE